MYYITKGDCAVNFAGTDGRIKIAEKLLIEGDHFGEVSMIYNCARTGTVISRNYNTLCHLSYQRYRLLISEFPIYEKELKRLIFQYDDDRKKFMVKQVQKTECFR